MNKQSRTTAAAGACRLQLTSLSTWGQRFQPSFRPKVAVLIGCSRLDFTICQNRVFVVQCHTVVCWCFFNVGMFLLMSYCVWLAMCGWRDGALHQPWRQSVFCSEVPFAGPSQIRAHAQKTVAWASKMLPVAVQWVLLEFLFVVNSFYWRVCSTQLSNKDFWLIYDS